MCEHAGDRRVDFPCLFWLAEPVPFAGLGEASCVAHVRDGDRTAILGDGVVLEVGFEAFQCLPDGGDAAGAAHRPGNVLLRPVLGVPCLDLRLPRHLVAESGVAVGAHDLVPVVELVHGGVDLAARDSTAPCLRVPDGGTPVLAVARSEDEALACFGLDACPVVVLGAVEAEAHLGALRRVLKPKLMLGHANIPCSSRPILTNSSASAGSSGL